MPQKKINLETCDDPRIFRQGVDLDSLLSPEQKAESTAYIHMVENTLYNAMVRKFGYGIKTRVYLCGPLISTGLQLVGRSEEL